MAEMQPANGQATAASTVAVAAECPLCLWRSAEVSLRDEVNAEWHARQEAAKQYRAHFDQHRPLPLFVQIEGSHA